MDVYLLGWSVFLFGMLMIILATYYIKKSARNEITFEDHCAFVDRMFLRLIGPGILIAYSGTFIFTASKIDLASTVTILLFAFGIGLVFLGATIDWVLESSGLPSEVYNCAFTWLFKVMIIPGLIMTPFGLLIIVISSE